MTERVEIGFKDRLRKRAVELKAIRQPWESTWWDIFEHMAPYRPVKWLNDGDRGQRKDSKILNNTPLNALDVGVAGLMAGITSPVREWHRETLEDQELAEFRPVKIWLDRLQRGISGALARSNWYSVLTNDVYPDIYTIGTAALFEEEDVATGRLVFMGMRPGEFWLDVDHFGAVDTCYREKRFTIRQMVQKFGLENCPKTVQDAWNRGDYATRRTVAHLVLPNDEFEANALGYRGKRWASCWWDETDEDKNNLLRKSGYDTFPVLAPRWTSYSGEVYGRGPGWNALGDCRELQHYENKNHKMVDKIVDPPMKSFGVSRASLLPGDSTQMTSGSGMYEPAMKIDPNAIAASREKIVAAENRIDRAFYVDLWRSILDDTRDRKTATEVQAIQQERMVMLGPLLENLNGSLLEPVIVRSFNILINNPGALPEPPPELRGQQIKISLISIMHQMQQALGLTGVRTFVDEVGRLIQINADVADKIDTDVAVDEIGSITGVRPDMIIPTEDANKQRAERAKAEQAQQTGDAMVQAAGAMKDLGQTDGANIQDLAGRLAPVAAAQGGALGA